MRILKANLPGMPSGMFPLAFVAQYPEWHPEHAADPPVPHVRVRPFAGGGGIPAGFAPPNG